MRVRIVGAYLPRLDQDGITRFITISVAEYCQTMHVMRDRGISKASREEVDDRASKLPMELRADLQTCALFEAVVTENDADFDPSDFENPDTSYCGWEPAFLSLDGENVIFEGFRAPSDLRDFRVAFYVHEWNEFGRLVGPTGELDLPEFAPVPERLWKLAPYCCVD